MSAQSLTETLATKQSALRERLTGLYQQYQYEPWVIRVTTLDRRLLLALLCLPVLLIILLIVLIVALTISSTECQSPQSDGSEYRGPHSITEAGFRCLVWAELDRNVHTVTPDRYPEKGLGAHNSCRNPDGSPRAWCYTNLTSNSFDFCNIPLCGNEGPAKPQTASFITNKSPHSDMSCEAAVTVINTARSDGLYVMTDHWANGRGVYKRQEGQTVQLNEMCLSWHGLYRHWWLGPCTHRGLNAGMSWLEEDARCPDQGKVWRAGGTDKLMPRTKVVTYGKTGWGCLEYETVYQGGLLDDRILHEGHLFTPRTETAVECQDLCLQVEGCVAFTWFRTANCTLWQSLEGKTQGVANTVSGSFSCGEKVKVGCPEGSEKINDDICLKFLESVCEGGCSRYAAMEECEQQGGYLADSLTESETKDLLDLATTKYNHSFWWVGASDFSKRGGKFSWEMGDSLVPDMAELWVNTSSHALVGGQGEGSSLHECVFIAPDTRGMRLDHQNCQANIGRPLCQFRPR